MMKRLSIKNEKGMTLLEVLVAVFILAMIAMPLLNLMAANIRTSKSAEQIVNSTYTAQSLAEELYAKSYTELFASQYSKQPYHGKFASVKVVPSGSYPNLVGGGQACYAHLIFQGGKATFVGPDGVLQIGSAGNVTLKVSSTGYTLSGEMAQSGTKPNKPLVLIVNTGSAALSGAVNITVNGAACALYRAPSHEVKVSGASQLAEYANDTPPKTMMVSAVCMVYDSAGGGSPSSAAEPTLEVAVR